MIKKLINKLLGKDQAQAASGKRTEIPASIHRINPQLVDERAADVVRTL